MSELQDARRKRAAQNQSTFRLVNEQLENLASTFQFVSHTGVFICECADMTCTQQVEMTMAEYEEMRADPNRFVVLPGHEIPDVEDVIRRAEGFVVVSKIGVGDEIVRQTDPRSSTRDETGPGS
jgi:hypothetical protein